MSDEARERLGKLFGRLGSDHAGERDNAIAAIDKALTSAGRGWSWISELVSMGELPSATGGRDQLLANLVEERISECLAESWSLSVQEVAAIGRIVAALKLGTGLRGVTDEEIAEAVRISTVTRRRIGRR